LASLSSQTLFKKMRWITSGEFENDKYKLG